MPLNVSLRLFGAARRVARIGLARIRLASDGARERHAADSRPHLHRRSRLSLGRGIGHQRYAHRSRRCRCADPQATRTAHPAHRPAWADGDPGHRRFAHAFALRRICAAWPQFIDARFQHHGGKARGADRALTRRMPLRIRTMPYCSAGPTSAPSRRRRRRTPSSTAPSPTGRW